MGEILRYWRGPAIPPRMTNVVTLWHEDGDGWIHRNQGRFYHRRNPAHISRILNAIEMRHLREDEVWT